MEMLFAVFVVALFLNARAAFKLALDWKGMVITLRFVRDAGPDSADTPRGGSEHNRTALRTRSRDRGSAATIWSTSPPSE